MKYFYLFAFLIFFALEPCFAQITITKANMPVAGDQFIFSTTDDMIDVKPTGANHSWDFSKLTPLTNDTFIYKKPSDINVFYALAFNGSIALKQPGLGGGIENAYAFFKATNTAFTQVGYGINLGVADLPIKYTDEDEIYNFPLNFKRTDSSTFAANTTIPGYGTLKIEGSRVSIVDGWGTIKTPYKTYNCIRIRSIVKEIDSIAGQGVRNDRIEIKWLALEEKVPVLQVVGSVQNGQFVQQSVEYRDNYRNIVNPNAPKAAFTVNDSVVMVKDTVVFKNLSAGMQNQYYWTFSPNTVTFISGTSASSANPQVVFNAKGKYSVSLRAINFAGSNQLTKTDYILAQDRVSGVGTETNNNSKIFSIYPNPSTTGSFSVILTEEMLKAKSKVEVQDLQGRIIVSKVLNNESNNVNIDLGNKPKGIYLINIINNNSISSQKVILE